MRALVVGGGVAGLTTAHALLTRGYTVQLVASQWAPGIVSSVAAAIWHPYQVAHPDAPRWAAESARRFLELAEREGTGVSLVRGNEYFQAPIPRPAWADSLAVFRVLDPGELPTSHGAGFRFEVPLIETPRYMLWLREEVAQWGAAFQTRHLTSLSEVVGEWPLVVNCTGLGARELVRDALLEPIRGQIVKVAPGLTSEFVFDEEFGPEPIYLIPRRDGLIVGGTATRGDWDQTVRDAETQRILARASAFLPTLADAPVLDVLVGLRPGRPTVRLEAEPWGNTLVIHNYGHGGAGFTLSWGCAEEVARLAASLGNA